MLDWERLTLLFYVMMRMSGFILLGPLFNRSGIPAMVRGGLIVAFSLATASFTAGGVAVPATFIEFGAKLMLELALGYVLGFVMQLFFYIPLLAGEVVDTQMGLAMAKTYDASANASLAVAGSVFNILMFLLFFAANGHHTLIRILITSGDIIPYGTVALGPEVSGAVVELFLSCTLLAVKMSMPILAAELMGQVGMGLLMKAIPQIHVFSINIEMKVIIGLVLLLFLIAPFSEFLLAAENQMLVAIQDMLYLIRDI